jgi:hypothetical protein
MTPFELRLCLEARNENLVDDRARDLWHAWHTAYLGRVDKFPHLGELMPKILQHDKPEDAGAKSKPDPNLSRNLMNALLQLPAAPPPPKDPPPASSDADVPTDPAAPASEESA